MSPSDAESAVIETHPKFYLGFFFLRKITITIIIIIFIAENKLQFTIRVYGATVGVEDKRKI